MNQPSARIATTLDKLAGLYQRRKCRKRPVEWLFPRCRKISAAYLAALNSERSA
jgi:hypothetical protein